MDPWTRKVLIVLWLLVVVGGIGFYIYFTRFNPQYR